MTLHEKLVAIQSDLKAPKGQKNTFGNYRYRSCEDILEALKPLLSEHKLSLTLSDCIVMVGTRFYVQATATVTFALYRTAPAGESQDDPRSVSVTAYAREEESRKGMDSSQITGAASSYARKYALNGLFCIDDTKDADTMDNRKSDPPLVIDEKFGTVEEQRATKADPRDVTEIARLCNETNTDHAKLYSHFGVKGVATKEQAKLMLVSLKAKLSKQIDSSSAA